MFTYHCITLSLHSFAGSVQPVALGEDAAGGLVGAVPSNEDGRAHSLIEGDEGEGDDGRARIWSVGHWCHSLCIRSSTRRCFLQCLRHSLRAARLVLCTGPRRPHSWLWRTGTETTLLIGGGGWRAA